MEKERFCGYCAAPFIDGFNKIEKICNFCGNEWTLDHSDYEKAYQDASCYRNAGQFDSADMIYSDILRKNPEDFKALWGKLLCKYGVVYIEKEDEVGQSKSRVITCYKKVEDSFEEEYDLLKRKFNRIFGILTYRETAKRNEDAKYIASIQKKLRKKSDECDIFLCYKETDYNSDGKKIRTEDSKDAEELYKLLTEAGYRVFFAMKSLRGKEGADYEAEIFKAIESAKVMLVLGTRAEYMGSVWMKNEWQRFLWVQNACEEKEKTLINLVDCDFYQLPDQLKKSQGFRWKEQKDSKYTNLKIRLDELIPKLFPEQNRGNHESDARKIADSLVLQYEGKKDEAYTLIREAAESGYSEAAYMLGCDYYDRDDGNEKAREDAFHWFKKAAENGHRKAMWQLSFMYELGIGTQPDPASARIWSRYYNRFMND